MYEAITTSPCFLDIEETIDISQIRNEAKTIAKKVAKSYVSVLILGESGTGKELFAQAIHNASLSKASEILGIIRKTLYNKINESERLTRVKNTYKL